MKIRTGFVSNSSSSSFIVIRSGDNHIPNLPETLVVDGKFGETEFGWQRDEHWDFGSKLIFAYLQTIYRNNFLDRYYKNRPLLQNDHEENWLDMLEKVVIQNTNVKRIEWLIGEDERCDSPNWAYIDHQSNAAENQNIEMFDNEDNLKAFLFGGNSKICTDNDNH